MLVKKKQENSMPTDALESIHRGRVELSSCFAEFILPSDCIGVQLASNLRRLTPYEIKLQLKQEGSSMPKFVMSGDNTPSKGEFDTTMLNEFQKGKQLELQVYASNDLVQPADSNLLS